MVRAVRWSVVAGMLAAGVLAGCNSSPDDPVTPTPSPSVSSSSASPSASPSPSVTASGPQIPAAAREKTDAGAEAFVKYFFERYNTAWTAPAPGLILELSDPACEFCTRAEKTAVTLEGRGDRYDRAPVSVRSVEQFVGAKDPQKFLFVELVQNRANVVSESGEVVHTDKRAELRSNVVLVWRDKRWFLLGVEEA